MKKIIYQSLAAIGLMGIAYYMNNPKKYNRAAKKLSDAARSQVAPK